MKRLKIHILFLLLCILFNQNTAFAKTKVETTDSKIKITAQSAIVMDLSTGAILYGKNINKKMYPASITKIMTALLALEHSSLSDVITFSHDAVFNVDPNSSRLWVDEGEKLTMESCLYGLMLASANDLAYAIAEKIGGTYSNFVDMMNQRATELGCMNTNFTNPHGLSEEEHYTTAYDMALISKEAFEHNLFRTIVGTKEYIIPKSNKEEKRYLSQHHKMTYNNSYHYEWFVGGKTGYTVDAGNTLVTFAKKNDRMLVCILLRPSDKYVQYEETKTLLNYGFDNFSQVGIPSSLPPAFETYASFLHLKTLPDSIQVTLPNGSKPSELGQKITVQKGQTASAETPLARVQYTYKNLIVGTHDIFYTPLPDTLTKDIDQPTDTDENVPAAASHSKGNPVLILLLLLVLLLILLFCFYVFYLLPIRRKRHSYSYRRQHQQTKRR